MHYDTKIGFREMYFSLIHKRTNNLENYGFEYPLQREEIKEKCKLTNLDKYGVEYVSQYQEFKDKCKKNNFEKYGVEHFTQTDIMKEKTKNTNLEKYGVEHNLQRPEIKEQIKQTCLKKYGVESCMQNSEIHDKQEKNSYYLKEYTLPSGNKIKIQGLEQFALYELFQKENMNENDIITGCKNVPTIWYNDYSGKKHRHFVDIYIPSQNKCIEIKSTWTFEKQKEVVFLKLNAAKELGYLYEIWVYDGKGNRVDFYN
jgi:hypothetical protein